MNIALERLFEGIIATLRADVIPHVGDPFARGQAVGVIDLINNIGPQVEWARAPLLQKVRERRQLLRTVAGLLGTIDGDEAASSETMDSAELSRERDRLDVAICEAMATAHARCMTDEAARHALGLIVRHAHDEAARDLKMSRKPLFAEIASGKKEAAAPHG
jgi:hypothetical protein